MGKLGHILFVIVLLALIAGGALAAWPQVKDSLAATELHEPVVWGLYVVCSVFCLGVGAGALVVASLALAHGRPQGRTVAGAGALVSLVSVGLAGLFILLDIGRIDRAMLMMTKARIESPLFWDFVVIDVLIVIAVFYLLCVLAGSRRAEPKPVSGLLRLLAGLFGIAVPVLYVVTVRVFSTLQARPDWNTPVLTPVFLASGMLAGLAAVMVVVSVSRAGRAAMAQAPAIWRVMADGLFGLIVVDTILTLGPVVGLWSSGGAGDDSIWAGLGELGLLELLVGMIAPALIMVMGRRKPGFLAGVAGLLVLSGVFIKRWHIIIPAMTRRAFPLPEASYTPNIVELGTVVALAAAGVLFAYVALQVLKKPAVAAVSAE